MPRTEKQSMVVEDVKLERVRVAFPTGLTVPQAGMLIGGAGVCCQSPRSTPIQNDSWAKYGRKIVDEGYGPWASREHLGDLTMRDQLPARL
jgi:hypothetical protein